MNPIQRVEGDTGYRFEELKSTNLQTKVVTLTSSSIKPTVSFQSSRDGGYLPDWKDRIRTGRNATTSLVGVKRKVSVLSPGYSRLHSITGVAPALTDHKYANSGRLIGIPFQSDWGFLTPNSSNATADSIASGKFYNSGRKALRTFSGGVFIAELRQVVSQIRSPAKALKEGLPRFLTAVKKAVRKSKNRPSLVAKAAADSWLQYSFGVKPLLADIDDAMKALAAFTTYQQQFEEIQGEGEQEYVRILTTDQYIFTGNIVSNVTRRCIENQYVKYYGTARIGSQFPTGNLDHNQFGLGLDEFIPTMWEVLPYSWLADYFFNIGEIINAASFPISHIARVSKLQRKRCLTELAGAYDEKTTKAMWGNAYRSGYSSPGRVAFSYTSVNRQAINTSQIYTPTIQFKLNLGWRQVANMASVFVQGRSTEARWQSLRI